MPVLHMEPPTSGLNARDSLDGLSPNEALEMTNWVPDIGFVRSRNGFVPYADLETGTPVETLIPLRLTTGSRLLAVSGLQIFDITDPQFVDPLNVTTTVGTNALPEVMLSNRVTFAQFQARAIITQQGNTPFIYQPTAGDPEIYEVVLGVYTEFIDPDLQPPPELIVENLVKPLVYKGRVLYVDAERLSFWYCQAGSFQGEITQFQLSGIFQRGGSIRLLFTWSKDTGDGMDDMLVIMSDTGETLIYQGDDPDDVLGWELIQRYQLPEPIADLGVDRIGAETIIITDDGYINLSEALSDGSITDYATFSSKITRIVKQDLNFYQRNYGWAAVFYPHGNMMLFNVPIRENAEHYQHIFNTRNGSWCTFQGWNANSMVVYEDRLHFGTIDGFVRLADVGTSDNGEFIECNCITAYTQYDEPARTKHMTSMTIIQNHVFPSSFSLNALADFRRPNLPPLVRPQEQEVGQWDISDWDKAYWGVGSGIVSGKKFRRPIQATGHSIALSVRQMSAAQNVHWFAHTVEYTYGGRK